MMPFTSANPHINNECVRKGIFCLIIAVLVRGAEEGTLISMLSSRIYSYNCKYRIHKLVKK